MTGLMNDLRTLENAFCNVGMAKSALFFIVESLEGDGSGPILDSRISEYVGALNMVLLSLQEQEKAAKLAIDRLYKKHRTAAVEG